MKLEITDERIVVDDGSVRIEVVGKEAVAFLTERAAEAIRNYAPHATEHAEKRAYYENQQATAFNRGLNTTLGGEPAYGPADAMKSNGRLY